MTAKSTLLCFRTGPSRTRRTSARGIIQQGEILQSQAIAHIEQAIDIRKLMGTTSDPEKILKHWVWLDGELEMALAALYPAPPLEMIA